jgi:hypothetical protein
MASSSPAMASSMTLLQQHALQMGYSHQAAFQAAQGLMMRHAAKTAQISGFDDAFIIGALIVISAFIPSLFLPGKPIHHTQLDPAEMVAAD